MEFPVKCWEYKIIDDQLEGNPDSVFELNELGKDGWELVFRTSGLGGERWYFKREVKENTSV